MSQFRKSEVNGQRSGGDGCSVGLFGVILLAVRGMSCSFLADTSRVVALGDGFRQKIHLVSFVLAILQADK